MGKQRDAYFDNMKFLLIVLVVIGHAMQVVRGGVIDAIYSFIYLFHMPAFVFISGYFFGKSQTPKIGNQFLQYMIFQTLYLGFLYYLKNNTLKGVVLQYTTPYWILWFSLALIIWKLAAPYVAKIPFPLGMALAVIVAVLAGYENSIGRYLTLSRAIVFFPFFLWGYSAQEDTILKIKKISPAIGAAVLSISFFVLWKVIAVSRDFLYHAGPYAGAKIVNGEFAGLYRLLLLVWGAVLIVAFMACVPRKEYFFTKYGKNSLNVFLLHGFIIRWMMYWVPGWVGGVLWKKICFFAAMLALTFLLASKPVAFLLSPLVNPIKYLKKVSFKKNKAGE